MRRRGKRASDLHAPYGTCPGCGWAGQDWGFKYHRYCTKCHNEWRKARAEERRRLKPPKPLKPPNENIEVADGIIITRNVRERLKKRAHRDVPRTREMLLYACCASFAIFMSLITLVALLFTAGTHPKYAWYLGTCAAIGFAMFYLFDWLENTEGRKRLSQVDARLEELARERQRQINEASAFYASSEWRLVREQVVGEQGRVCRECGCHIRTDYDLTVDHIKPRSKFPELALDKSNLQVLCRRCNSAKGATYNEASITVQPTEPS